MNKYKICVYAICKNEEKFVDRWFDSVKEADEIFVLDTGSTDNTISKLKKLGVNVNKKVIEPWRFDKARNLSLDLIPKDIDICVCLDLDEIIENGWREQLEENWKYNTTRAKYTYNWLLDENNNPKVSFYSDKIHKRKGYKWKYPVHEVLECSLKEEKYILIENLVINHYPDSNKSRSNYLPLLELSVEENPDDDRNVHYLGREYMYYQRWNESIDTLIKHLNLKTSTWKDERCASMRFISRSYQNLHRYDEAKMWLEKAINEAPYLRDPYLEMAFLEDSLENYNSVIFYCEEALKIERHPKTYINEQFSFDGTVYDLLSVAYFSKKNYAKALENVNKALEYNSSDVRLLNNKEIMLKFFNSLK